MAITTSNFSNLLLPWLKTTWGDTYMEWAPEYPLFMDKEISTQAFEQYQEIIGFDQIPVKNQGQSVYFQTTTQGLFNTIVNTTYGGGFIITSEMVEDDQYKKMEGLPKSLAKAVRRTEENLHANFAFNRGFNTSFTFADGQPLYSTAHPLSGSSGTLANTLSVTADISETSIRDAIAKIARFTGAKGEQIQVMPKKLIVAPEEDFTASKLMFSSLEPETGNNAVNPIKMSGRFPEGFMVSHYITDPRAWFIKTDAWGLISQERKAAVFSKDNEFESDNARYKVVFRLGVGVTDIRAMFGVTGGTGA